MASSAWRAARTVFDPGFVSWATRYRLPLVRTGAPTVGSLTRTRSRASVPRSASGMRPTLVARRWLIGLTAHRFTAGAAPGRTLTVIERSW